VAPVLVLASAIWRRRQPCLTRDTENLSETAAPNAADFLGQIQGSRMKIALMAEPARQPRASIWNWLLLSATVRPPSCRTFHHTQPWFLMHRLSVRPRFLREPCPVIQYFTRPAGVRLGSVRNRALASVLAG
jgi:hypothetical protein